ncbi:hypothetical protein ACFQI7_33530 [Paenibacillus allorhizosphaerae]|nr:hypothetical protein [Paenibacillus allorhizosphaerae]
MAIGILDVWVTSDVDASSMVLVTDCMNGYPHELYGLQDGMSVTLSKGSAEKEVRIVRENSNECSFHYMELHPQTAKDLGVANGSRCRVNLDEIKMEMKLTPVSVSRYYTNVQIDRHPNRQNRIVMGYSLLSMLGIRHQAKSAITVKLNSAPVKLRLNVPENELDDSCTIPAQAAAKLGITHNGSYMLEYNHATRILGLPEGEAHAEPFVVEQTSSVSVKRQKQARERRTGVPVQMTKSRNKGTSAQAAVRTIPTVTATPVGQSRIPPAPWLHPSVVSKKRAR